LPLHFRRLPPNRRHQSSLEPIEHVLQVVDRRCLEGTDRCFEFGMFSRYFSPLDHNQPATINELYAANDVELFDLDTDPDETINLAADKTANNDLVLAMNTKLSTIIKAEIGVDDGRELPKIPLVKWTIDRIS
jgi:hypothetical protein